MLYSNIFQIFLFFAETQSEFLVSLVLQNYAKYFANYSSIQRKIYQVGNLFYFKRYSTMKKHLITLFFLLSNLIIFAQKQADKEEWVSLFNGKDLTGWDLKISGHEMNDNYKNTFLVEDGMMRVNYKEYQNFDDKYGHIYYKTPYSHYRIRFEYRFQGNQVREVVNLGIYETAALCYIRNRPPVMAKTKIFLFRSKCSFWEASEMAHAIQETSAPLERLWTLTENSTWLTASTQNLKRMMATNG